MLKLRTVLGMVWTSPNTVLGLIAGGGCLVTGGRVQLRSGSLEFYGKALAAVFRRLPVQPVAMTFGQVILGADAANLDRVRDHEQVHVRQYLRWGPLFLPVYLGCSAVLWVRGRDPYRDNPFEIAAYSHDERRRQSNPVP